MKIAKDILIAFQILSDNMGCLTVHQLSQMMRISRTQAKQIVEDCIYWLEKKGVPLKDEKEKRTVAVSTDGLVQLRELLKNISQKEYYYSFFERRKYIVFMLLTKRFVTNYQICETFEISRNTCIADMTAISRFLKENGFQAKITSNNKGYMLAGREVEIRRLIPYYISLIPVFSSEEDAFLYHVDEEILFRLYGFDDGKIRKWADRLVAASNELGRKLSLQSAVNISLAVELIAQRIGQGNYVENDSVSRESTTAYTRNCIEYLILKSGIWQEIKNAFKSGAAETENGKEILNIEKELLCQTIVCIGSIQEDNLEQFVMREMPLEQFAEQIIVEFEERIGLGCTQKEEVIEKLSQSLSGVLLRQSCGFQIYDPFVETIRRDYKYIFDVTREMNSIREQGETEISENGAAYLTAQLIGWFIKGDEEKQKQKIPLVGIVCANNIGIGALVEKQIQSTFLSVRTILIPSYEISYWTFYNKLDLLVAPMLLKIDENIPCVRVHPFLTAQDKGNISRMLTEKGDRTADSSKILHRETMYILKDFLPAGRREEAGIRLEQLYNSGDYEIIFKGARKYMLKDLLTADRIQFTDDSLDWRAAVRLASAPLIEDGSITQNYVRAMIDSIETTGPYIVLTPGVALPHARPFEGAKKLAMAMLCSKKRIYFNEEKYANILVVLSSVDGHSHINALVHLSNMFSEEEALEKFIQAQTVEEVVELLHRYEED